MSENHSMRTILSTMVAVSLLITMGASAHAIASLSVYASEDQAQQHCPRDTIVWLNVETRAYSLKGQRSYGRGRNSAYACKSEADAAGARSSLNGS
jgi:hypothetical protein